MAAGAIASIISSVLSAASSDNKAGVDGQQAQNYGNAAKGTEQQIQGFKSEKPMEQPQSKGLLGDIISDETTKDTTQSVGKQKWSDLSWNDKKDRINGIVDTVSNILSKAKSLGDNSSDTVQPIDVGNFGSPAVSDGTLKNKEKIERLFQNDNAIKAFSDIDAYVYKYNQKAQDTYAGEKGVDDETHFGPIAQDLAKNPVTSGTVHRDESGYLTVDTRQLTLTNTAMISQLARKIEELEERIGGR